MPSEPVRFREVQQLHQPWMLALAAVAAALAWLPLVVTLASGRAADGEPIWFAVVVAAVFGVGLPAVVWYLRLTVEVGAERIDIRYRPFARRVIDLADVTEVAAVRYRPVREYGGWGIKGWTRRKVAYNVSGNRGVLVTLGDGRTVLLGSQRPDELAAALETARRPAG